MKVAMTELWLVCCSSKFFCTLTAAAVKALLVGLLLSSALTPRKHVCMEMRNFVTPSRSSQRHGSKGESRRSENSHDAYLALPVPLEPDEHELDDEFLAHALAESLRDTSEQELDDELLAHTLPDSSSDPYLALPVPDPDELEGISPSEASPRREGAPAAADDGDGIVAARRGSGKDWRRGASSPSA